MSGTRPLTDTRDMKCVHDVFRRALGDAPSQISAVDDGDTEKAAFFAAYLAEALWLLHAHHDGEDVLLYPLLAEREPEESGLFSRMEAQHVSVTSAVQAAERATERFGESGSKADGDALASACRSLLDELDGHLTEEEDQVVPIASRTVTPEEWGALPAHVLGSYRGERLWLPLGLVVEQFPEDLFAAVIEHVPPPVSEMWFGVGSAAFAEEMATIRGTGG